MNENMNEKMMLNIDECFPGETFFHEGKMCKCISINDNVVKYSIPLSNGVRFIDYYRRKSEPEPSVPAISTKEKAEDVRVVKLEKGKFFVETLSNKVWHTVNKPFKTKTKAENWIADNIEVTQP